MVPYETCDKISCGATCLHMYENKVINKRYRKYIYMYIKKVDNIRTNTFMYVCCVIFLLIVPTITTISPSIGVLNGENVTIACIPSDPDIEMFWVYETADGSRDSVTVANVSVTRFLSDSPLLHRLVLPNATYSDAGTYQCVAQGLIGSVVRKLTRLNVLPSKFMHNKFYYLKTRLCVNTVHL